MLTNRKGLCLKHIPGNTTGKKENENAERNDQDADAILEYLAGLHILK